jgi:hypothetical protein
MDRLDRILALVRRYRPGLRLVDKHEVPLARASAHLLRPLMPRFMDNVTTVIGDTVYLPGPPERLERELLARILAHELVHQLDQAEHGLAFYVSYVVAPLPVGRTMRAHWERRAYAVDLMLAWADGGDESLARTAESVAVQFSGPTYGWMWVGADAARKYVGAVADEIRSGTLQQRSPYREILAAWTGEDGWR